MLVQQSKLNAQIGVFLNNAAATQDLNLSPSQKDNGLLNH